MYNVYGTICETYEEACIVAGIDTPAQLEAEDAWYAMLNEVENLSHPVETVGLIAFLRGTIYGRKL